MADITSFAGISADELTEVQLNAIIEKINLAIYNIAANRFESVHFAEFGAGGHKKDTAPLLAALLSAKKTYEDALRDLPFEGTSLYDDPDL